MRTHQMRVRAFAGLLLLGIAQHASAQLEFKMISSGGNRPGIAIWNPPMREILAGLHGHIDPSQLATILGLDRPAFAAKLDSMKAEGVIKDVDGALHPTCMVITAEEGDSLASLASDIARRALPFMRKAVARAENSYRTIAGLHDFDFSDVSFFIASDVLLDSWQIGSVESDWLHAERPLRGRVRYYCAIQTRSQGDREAFGIYGNQVNGVASGRALGVYGNRRGGPNDLSALPAARLAALTGLPDSTSRASLLSNVITELQRIAREKTTTRTAASLAAALDSLGLTRAGKPRFAVLDSTDMRQLDVLAASVTDSLVSFLNGVTPQLRTTWQKSSWHNEVTFEEFRIWWYHFFYTALTDLLAREGTIRIPDTGLFHYVVVGG